MTRHDYRAAQRKRWSSFQVRCRKCEARASFERHPESYHMALRCASCGHLAADRDAGWRPDWYRISRKESKARGVCFCRAAPFPHRKGFGLYDGGKRVECR
jgi:ribosomal protein S27E